MIKSKELAKLIGVSEATISLVINNKPGISEKTRRRVSERIQELGHGYLLQDSASWAASEETEEKKVLSFIIYKNKGELLGMNSFFPLILDGIEMAARKLGFTLNVINIEKQQIETQIQYIRESGCVGYVVFGTELHMEETAYFERLGIPFVVLDNYFVEKSICCTKVDNFQGIYMALKHLHDMGHRKVGYLDSGVDIDSFTERKHLAIALAERFGLNDMRHSIYTVGYPHENAEKGMRKLLETYKKEELPTAFITDNDLVVVGAINAVKDYGYKVPDDFSFIGYDDRPICTMISPKLSTIQVPRERFGAAAVEHLAKMILNNEKLCETTMINVNLILRETVADRR